MTHAQFSGIKFYSAGQLWSNPSLRQKNAGIPVMMAKPSFLDLVNLAAQTSVHELFNVNRSLLDEGLIDQGRFSRSESMLQSIAAAQNALALR
jgi:hypothetical protein